MTSIPDDLKAIFQAGIDAVAGQHVVSKALMANDYSSAFHVVAIGKAADAMLQGVPDSRILSALLISKHGHISKTTYQNTKIQCIEADHPIPKEDSIKAGLALLSYLKQLPEKSPCLFLISGGTSALVEVLQDGWTLEDLSRLTDYLLANAYSINEINSVRRQVSKIKGGGLWNYMGERSVTCLMISDVPNDDPTIIGSGLLYPSNNNQLLNLPQEWLNKLNIIKPNKVPKSFNGKVIACLDDAKKAAGVKAKSLGYQIKIMSDFLDSDAQQTAKKCVKTLQENKKQLCIWGGETTVNLPENAGQGGRNQHLALAAAIEMEGMENTFLLAAGTDGSDGMTTATGAIVEGLTVKQGLKQKLKAKDYLQKADSNSFLKATGSLIITGATGTNVMDLVLGIAS